MSSGITSLSDDVFAKHPREAFLVESFVKEHSTLGKIGAPFHGNSRIELNFKEEKTNSFWGAHPDIGGDVYAEEYLIFYMQLYMQALIKNETRLNLSLSFLPVELGEFYQTSTDTINSSPVSSYL